MLYPLSYGRALDGSDEFTVLSVELGGAQWALRANHIQNQVARKLRTHNSELAACSSQRLYRAQARLVKGLDYSLSRFSRHSCQSRVSRTCAVAAEMFVNNAGGNA